MYVEVDKVLPADLEDAAWRLYAEAFDELRYEAAQRHVMVREEFDEVLRDDRVLKYYVRHGHEVLALSTLTRDLDAVPLISPEYFQRRWPQLYAEGRIFYLGFMAVRSGRRGAGLFVRLARRMYEPVTEARGIVAMDICAYNERELALPEAIARASSRVAGQVRHRLLDTQSYWVYEFPALT